MTQSIFIQVGQCGNQIGHRFWDLALQEHDFFSDKLSNNDAFSSFFYNETCKVDMGSKSSLFKAVLVDMEEGAVGELFKGPLRNIFDNRYLVTDVSGSGNNWAVGHFQYGKLHHEALCNVIRKSAELCDSLQCFFLLHSMGGGLLNIKAKLVVGTGSGIGTYILNILADEYPSVYRMNTAVFPSIDDDVITSPYNTVLALHELTELADCVIPIDNFALSNILLKLKNGLKTDQKQTKKDINQNGKKPFDEMNNLIASVLINLTSFSRFEGTMNVDLNEIVMNLVPFPRLHYLIASQSPLSINSKTIAPRKLDQIFSDAFSRDYQLMSVEPYKYTYLSAALLVRGAVTASDLRRNIDRFRSRLQFVPWNRKGWKVGHCLIPPVNQQYSLLTLSNNTAIHQYFQSILQRFHKLYRRKAHLHHYNTVADFDPSLFETSVNSLNQLELQYEEFNQQSKCQQSSQLPQIRIMD